MSKNKPNELQVHECKFEVFLDEALLHIRFPCRIFVLWKSGSNQILAKTTNDSIIIENGVASIHQNIRGQVHVLYDKKTETYVKKETTLKPDEQKLVGRIVVDVAQVISHGLFSQTQNHYLSFCSVDNGSLTFNIRLLSKEKTNLNPNEIQSDSLVSQSQTLNKSLHLPKDDLAQFRKQDLQHQKQTGSTQSAKKYSEKEEIKQIQSEKAKLAEENQKLRIFLTQNNDDLDTIKEKLFKAQENIKQVQHNIDIVEKQKEKLCKIVEEQINQLNQENQQKIRTEAELSKMKNKLQIAIKNYEETEQIRLQNESEMLEIKFQLSELKTQRQIFEKYLLQKDQQLKKAIKEIEEFRKTPSFSIQASEISEREKSNNNEDILALSQNINQLEEEIKFKKNKQALNEFNQAYNLLAKEKTKLQEKLNKLLQDQEEELIKKQRQIQKLKSQSSEAIKEFKTKLKNLEQQNQRIKDQIMRYEKKRQQSLESMEEIEKENDVYKRTIKEKDSLIVSLQYSLSSKEVENKTIQDYYNEKNRSQEIKNSEIKQLKNQNEKLAEEIIEIESSIKLFQKDKEELAQMNSTLSQKNAHLENEINTIKSQIKSKEEILNEKRNTTLHLSRQMEEQIEKGQQYEERMMKLAEKEQKMIKNIAILEEEWNKIYNSAVLKEESEELRNQLIEESKLQIQKLQEDTKKSSNKISTLMNQNNQLRAELFNIKKNNLTEIEGEQLSSKQKLIAITNKRISQLEACMLDYQQEHQEEVNRLTTQLQQIRLSKQNVSNENKILRQQRVAEKQAKQSAQKTIKQFELEIQEIEERLHIMKQKLQSQNESLKVQLEIENNQINSLIKEKNTLSQQLQQSEQTRKHLQEKLDEMQSNEPYSPIKNLRKSIDEDSLKLLCKELRQLLQARQKKEKSETVIQFLISKNSVLEEKMNKIFEERGNIQETARRLSMQFQKIKSQIFKGKTDFALKKSLIDSLKPCENIVRDLVDLGESLSQVYFELEEYE